MIRTDAHLDPELFGTEVERKPTRDGFGHGVVEAGKTDKNIVVLCADLKESTRAEWFEKEFPERYVEVGVAEQNLATLAAGFAAAGKIPFIASYACFSPGRNYEQIRTTIALNNRSVKVMGMHAGVSVGPDGATHQMLEDIALMRALPRMTVIVPADAEEARKAVVAAAQIPGPVYIRFSRAATPVFTTTKTPFSVGTALTLWESTKPEVALIAAGALVHEALLAARLLDAEGIGTVVINLHTVKPLDEEALVRAAKHIGRVVTIEEHQAAGGVGSAVAECLARRFPVPMRFVAVHDRFGESGEPAELIAHFGLDAEAIVRAARELSEL